MVRDIIPRLSAEQRARSLGWLMVWWIENFVVLGTGDAVGKPLSLPFDYKMFIVDCYALDARGRRLFRHSSISMAKGTSKSTSLAAPLSLAEALAPCRFDHWAGEGESYEFLGETYPYEPGEPVGRPIRMPKVKILATSEGQTGNTYEGVFYNCTSGPLAQLQGVGLDAGVTRIGLPEGGDIMPVSSGAASKDGGLETFVVCDESHLYNNPKLRQMYQTVDRNLPKRGRLAEPWLLETTTMFKPGENSVAENTFKTAWALEQGKLKHKSGVYFNHRYANLSPDQFSDEKKLRRALYESYGSTMASPDGRDHIFTPDGKMEALNDDGVSDSGLTLMSPGVEAGPSREGWNDVDAIMEKILEPGTDVGESTRYYLNNLCSTENAYISEDRIQAHLYRRDLYEARVGNRVDADAWRRVVGPKDEITLGFDGSTSDDSTALVGCRVSDGLLFLIKLEQCPDGPEKAVWRVDREAFDGKVRWMFANYNVVGMFADPAFFESMVSGWENDFDGRLKVSPKPHGDKIKFWQRTWNKDTYAALQEMWTAFRYDMVDVRPGDKPLAENVRLLADPRLVSHFRNATRHERSFGYLVFKEAKNSPKKIDAMMAALLAFRARNKYLALAERKTRVFAPMRIR